MAMFHNAGNETVFLMVTKFKLTVLSVAGQKACDADKL